MAPMYYRNAKAAILVYDATEEKTLEMVQGWVDELSKHASKDVIFVLAGNKSDMGGNTQQSVETAQAKAMELGAKLFQTSAKTGKGIQELFDYVARALLDHALSSEDGLHKPSGRLNPEGESKGCC